MPTAAERQRSKRQRDAEAAQAGDEAAQTRRASRSEELRQRFGQESAVQQAARRAVRRIAAHDQHHPGHAAAAAALQRDADRSRSRRASTSIVTVSAKKREAEKREAEKFFGRQIDIPENGWPGYEQLATYITGMVMEYDVTGVGHRFFIEFPDVLATDRIGLTWAQLRGESPWNISPPTSVPRLHVLADQAATLHARPSAGVPPKPRRNGRVQRVTWDMRLSAYV